MKIQIEFDVSAYASEVDVFVERSFAPAIVDALNVAGRRARLAVIEAMPAVLDRPTPFTTGDIGLFEASLDNAGGKDAAAYLRIQPDRAQYLQYQILGGTRGPGDPGSTSTGPTAGRSG
ncbi:hypothetical protein [Methylobacterium gossipiicola]|uniref:Uncharacterized protein n=1 Tax=Methylobacterium gossipiicola TaxID=582675 RepID=A0A1I2UVY5_9HYPH|nr:hypothetical protein [Methylobacterium gossipiicola]SFG81335.1 hypothetical protein SAMN05192565_11239 [Methylobacterium gossipiicola]